MRSGWLETCTERAQCAGGQQQAVARHRAWLDEHYRAGVFIASGPKEPRTGGIILAVGISRQALQEVVDGDPFHTQGLATHTITEFHASRLGGVLSHEAVRAALG